MTNEPESLILQMMRGMRAEMADMRGERATKSDLALVREEIGTLRADVIISDLEARVRRVEQHVDLPPIAH